MFVGSFIVLLLMAADCRDSVPLTLSLRNIAAVVLLFL